MELFIAKRSFTVQTKKVGKTVVKKGDLAHAGHDLVKLNPDAFEPIKVKFAVEEGAGRGGRKTTSKEGGASGS